MSFTLYLLNRKGFEVLKAITKNSQFLNKIDCVVGSRDKGNNEDYYLEIKDLCNINKLEFFDRNEDCRKNQSDYSLAIGWRWLISPTNNLIVIHDSYLPFYRGFSPLVNMLINGEPYLAATAIWASERMDEGNIISQIKKPILYPCKIYKAIEIVAGIYVNIVQEIFTILISGADIKLLSTPQSQGKASYSIWRDDDDYFISWKESAEKIKRFIDAVGYPYDGAKTKIKNEDTVIRIFESTVIGSIVSEIWAPGKILMLENGKPIVLCGQGALRLDNYENMDGTEFNIKKFRTQFI